MPQLLFRNKVTKKREGYGIRDLGDGDCYYGFFKDGQMNGVARVFQSDERMYCGQNLKNEKHGIGMQLFKHGVVFIGEFNNTNLCKGAFLKDGDLIIEGTFVKNWIKYKSKNRRMLLHIAGAMNVKGQYYQGIFNKEGLPNGKGIITTADGDT